MTKVTTAGHALVVSSDTVPAAIANALPLGLLWSQAVTRAKGDPLGSDAYFTDLSDEMGEIGWNVTDAGTTTYSVTGSTAQPVQSIQAIAQSLLPPDQLSTLATMLGSIAAASAKSELGGFLTTWWDQRKDDAQGTVFAAAPAWIDNNLQLTTTLIQFDYAIACDSWQSFFLGQISKGAKVTARNITMSLNAPLWAPIQAPIEQKLGQAAIATITSLDL
jgi:hypothetical protein